MAAADGLGSRGSSADPVVVQANLHFLKKDARHQEEKPYAFRYEADTEDIPQSNMEMERVDGILIRDIRGEESDYSLDSNGFMVLRHQSALEYREYYDLERVWVYLHELEDLLKNHLNASKVEIFRHGVRLCNGTDHGAINHVNRCENVTLISLFLLGRRTNTINQPLLLILVEALVRRVISAN